MVTVCCRQLILVLVLKNCTSTIHKAGKTELRKASQLLQYLTDRDMKYIDVTLDAKLTWKSQTQKTIWKFMAAK